jgi:hypothetical protein
LSAAGHAAGWRDGPRECPLGRAETAGWLTRWLARQAAGDEQLGPGELISHGRILCRRRAGVVLCGRSSASGRDGCARQRDRSDRPLARSLAALIKRATRAARRSSRSGRLDRSLAHSVCGENRHKHEQERAGRPRSQANDRVPAAARRDRFPLSARSRHTTFARRLTMRPGGAQYQIRLAQAAGGGLVGALSGANSVGHLWWWLAAVRSSSSRSGTQRNELLGGVKHGKQEPMRADRRRRRLARVLPSDARERRPGLIISRASRRARQPAGSILDQLVERATRHARGSRLCAGAQLANQHATKAALTCPLRLARFDWQPGASPNRLPACCVMLAGRRDMIVGGRTPRRLSRRDC